MVNTIYKAIPCKISRGVFSTERMFALKKIPYCGFAPRHWCWNTGGCLLGKTEAADEVAVDGYVAARIVEKLKGGKVRVSIPNGELIEIEAAEMVERPTKVGSNVPV